MQDPKYYKCYYDFDTLTRRNSWKFKQIRSYIYIYSDVYGL